MSELTMAEENRRLRSQLAKTKDWLDITDVTLITGFSHSTIRRRVAEGRLKAYQNVPNGKLLFSKEQINKWVKGGEE